MDVGKPFSLSILLIVPLVITVVKVTRDLGYKGLTRNGQSTGITIINNRIPAGRSTG